MGHFENGKWIEDRNDVLNNLGLSDEMRAILENTLSRYYIAFEQLSKI